MKIIVFDTETTSLRPGQICQLAYLLVQGGRVEGKNMFFTVDEMDERSQGVHGFSMEMLFGLSGGLRFEDRAQEILDDFSGADMIAGHNVAFDVRFLTAEMTRAGLELGKIKTFCTMNYFTGNMMMRRKFQTYRPKPPKLVELKEYFGLDDQAIEDNSALWFGGGYASHDARFDTAMTYMCMKAAEEQGLLKGVFD